MDGLSTVRILIHAKSRRISFDMNLILEKLQLHGNHSILIGYHRLFGFCVGILWKHSTTGSAAPLESQIKRLRPFFAHSLTSWPRLTSRNDICLVTRTLLGLQGYYAQQSTDAVLSSVLMG